MYFVYSEEAYIQWVGTEREALKCLKDIHSKYRKQADEEGCWDEDVLYACAGPVTYELNKWACYKATQLIEQIKEKGIVTDWLSYDRDGGVGFYNSMEKALEYLKDTPRRNLEFLMNAPQGEYDPPTVYLGPALHTSALVYYENSYPTPHDPSTYYGYDVKIVSAAGVDCSDPILYDPGTHPGLDVKNVSTEEAD